MKRPSPKLVAILGVFAILGLSSAYPWQARDWNGSSRLMLTYSLVDRGKISINGLEDHTRDRARVGRVYYTDKLPGFSLLAVPPYLFARHIVGIPPHPVDRPGVGFTHWPADYWIALGTSGLATALTGGMLVGLAIRLGCSLRRGVLVGLSYGLATPASVYASLNYGHQVTAALLLGSFLLVWSRGSLGGTAAAGFLAAWAVVVELQVAPVAAIVGAYVLISTARRARPPGAPALFLIGAAGPMLMLACYNLLAFGSPLDMGYFHEDLAQFRQVHSAANPLGLRGPDASRVFALLWGPHRGLLFYAPLLALAGPGWIALGRLREVAMLGVSLACCAAVLMVNLSYPEWTGGWSTGPRLLLPLIPFAMIPVAGFLVKCGRITTALAVVLALLGWAEMLLFEGAGGRVPPEFLHPLRDFVIPAWRHGELARNVAGLVVPGLRGAVGPRAWLGWVPLAVFQLGAAAGLIGLVGGGRQAERAAGSRFEPLPHGEPDAIGR